MRDLNVKFMDKYWQLSFNLSREPFLPGDMLLYCFLCHLIGIVFVKQIQ